MKPKIHGGRKLSFVSALRIPVVGKWIVLGVLFSPVIIIIAALTVLIWLLA
jgi:hypothetical protein